MLPTDTSQADPKIVALMYGIKQQESKGNYNAIGDQGTAAGAGQWSNQPNGKPVPLAKGQIPSNFINAAKQYGLNPNDFSPENQNKVLYSEIAAGKQSGRTPEQILSAHNSGDPNKYLNTATSSGVGSVGAYNVSAYVKGAMSLAQQYAQRNNPSSTANQPEKPSVSGFIDNVASSAGNLISGLGNAVMHPIQTVQNIAGMATGAVEKPFGVQNEDTQKFDNVVKYFGDRYGGDSLYSIGKNIAKTAYTDPVGTALDLSTLLDGVGATIGVVGKVADVSRAAELAKASDYIATAQEIIKGGTPEAAAALETAGTTTKIGEGLKTAAKYTNPLAPVSGIVKSAANKLSQFSDYLPRRIINNLLPQLKETATKDYAIENLKVGSVDSMLKTSQDALDNYDSQIGTILKHPDNAGLEVAGSDIASKTLQQFPNSEYTPEYIFSKIKSQVPANAKLVTKLENGSLTLDEANTLRSAIDKVTYKLTIDSPEVKAGKELAGAFGNQLRETVKTSVPETRAIFDGYSKETNLKKALIKLQLKLSKKGVISMRELLTSMGATSLGGPIAGGLTLAGEKILEAPVAKVAGAKLLKAAITPIKARFKVVQKVAPYAKETSMAGKISNATQ